MGALVATTPDRDGTVVSGAAVAASDTIAAAIIGQRGCYLEIINGGGSPDDMTISDASLTPTGAAAAANAPTVTNGTSKVFLIVPQQVNTSTGVVTVTHSFTTSVTYKLYPLG
ncbi:MAG TPA: hypothetical protein VFC00_00395 [Micromonosporaceae bacterium]|nr:hypothetical protein [Micromonosporaceae bacterium]